MTMATGGSTKQPERGAESGNKNEEESSMHTCGICLQDFPKTNNPSRFAIFPECRHVVCLPCARTLRTTDGATTQQRRRCAICRQESDFVVPSNYYVEDDQKRANLVQDYKRNCGKKPCKYEEQRIGSCLRGANCHYDHDLIVGMNLLGEIAPVQSLRVSNTNIRMNRNTSPSTSMLEVQDEDVDEHDGVV